MNYADQRTLASFHQPTTMFGGVNPPRRAMFDATNIPGLSGNVGMFLSMALQPLITSLTQNMGYAGLQFSGTQNIYDTRQAHDFFIESRKAIQEASVRDEQHNFQRLLGVSRLTGTIIGPNQIRAAQAMAGDVTKMGTVFGDMMPDMYDEMFGTRGSAAVMARRIHLGGRYAIDPTSGELGLRGETAGKMSEQIYENLYGADKDLSKMQGFGAGRMGQLYDEMQRRGFMGSAPTTREAALKKALGYKAATDTKTVAEDLVNDSGKVSITKPEFDEMEKTRPGSGVEAVMGSQAVKESITKGESKRISDRLKGLVGAVSAMRDIFGDMGKPDAPMIELINGLQALTQGGLATMNTSQLEGMVRKTQTLAKMAGLSMDSMMTLVARGANIADQMGLDRKFAVQSAQGTAAFSIAFGSTGQGNVPGWRMPDKDTVASMDQSLRLSAAKSDVSNQFNATLRMADEMPINKKSELFAMAQAIKQGQVTYEYGGETKRVVKSFNEWQAITTAAGIDQDTAFAIRSNTIANQEYGAKYQTQDLTRLLQRDIDINPLLRLSGNVAFRNIAGQDTAKTNQLTNRMVEVLWGKDINGQAIQGGMTNEERADPISRYSVMVRELKAKAKDLGLKPTDDQLQIAAVRMWADFENRIQAYGPTSGFQGALGAFAANDPLTLHLAQQRQARANEQARLASALSGLGRTGPLRRFMDMLENTDGQTTFSEMIGEVLGGGVKKEVFADALKQNEFNQASKQWATANPDTPQGKARREEATSKMQRLLEGAGFTDEKSKLAISLQHLKDLMELRKDAPDTEEERQKRMTTKDQLKDKISILQTELTKTEDPAVKTQIDKQINTYKEQIKIAPETAPGLVKTKAEIDTEIAPEAVKVRLEAEKMGISTRSSAEDIRKTITIAENMQGLSVPKPKEPKDIKKWGERQEQIDQLKKIAEITDDPEEQAILKREIDKLEAQQAQIPTTREAGPAQNAATSFAKSSRDITFGVLFEPNQVKRLMREEGYGFKAVQQSNDKWDKLNVLAAKHGVTLAELMTGTGKAEAVYANPENAKLRSQVDSLISGIKKDLGVVSSVLDTKLTEGEKKSTITDEQNKQLVDEQNKQVTRQGALGTAEAMLKAVYGSKASEVAPETKKALQLELEKSTTRASVTDSLEALERVRAKIQTAKKRGETIREHERADEEQIKKIAGEDYQKIAPILKLLQQGSMNKEAILGAVPGADMKSAIKDNTVTLEGPIKLDGTVRIVGDQLYFDDVESINHRNPLRDTRGDRSYA